MHPFRWCLKRRVNIAVPTKGFDFIILGTSLMLRPRKENTPLISSACTIRTALAGVGISQKDQHLCQGLLQEKAEDVTSTYCRRSDQANGNPLYHKCLNGGEYCRNASMQAPSQSWEKHDLHQSIIFPCLVLLCAYLVDYIGSMNVKIAVVWFDNPCKTIRARLSLHKLNTKHQAIMIKEALKYLSNMLVTLGDPQFQ